jgi:AcrR family transcriptional regulator
MEDRVAVNNVRKFSTKSADKKYELAMHAISSLAELGFARINLRDIAVRSGVSLGVIHYYFENKTELLIYCVTVYKEEFIAGLKDLIARAEHSGRLLSGIADFLADTIDKQAHIHRLWYDVRAQAQFDDAFQPVVEEFEVLLTNIFEVLVAKLRELDVDCSAAEPLKLYLALDGWFRYCLQRKLMGDAEATGMLRHRVLAEFSSVFRVG